MVEHRGDRLRVWSAEDGLFRSSSSGASDAPVRIDEPCDSLDAISQDGSLLVACGRRPLPSKDGPGSITILRLTDGESIERSMPIEGRVGRDHQGLSIAPRAGGLVLAWHDGRPGDWGAWSIELDASMQPVDAPQRLSASRVAAGRPFILPGDPLLFTWAESWVEGGYPSGQVLVSDGRGRPRRAAEVIVQSAVPVLARDASGAVLFFRDIRRPNRRTSLFAMRIDESGNARGEPVRVGRSDGRGGPSATYCAGLLAVATPRSFGRTEVLVGVYLLDDALEERVKEQQVYQWAAQFTAADIACSEDTMTLLVGQRSHLEGDPATLHALPLRCAAP